MGNDKQQLIEHEMQKYAEKGEITCQEALKLAGKLQVRSRSVGESADKLKIKIRHCQLGCFK